MATFTISLTVGAQTFTYTESPTNANAQRIGAAYKALLGLPSETTDQQVWAALGKGIADGIKANVVAQEEITQRAAIVVPPMT